MIEIGTLCYWRDIKRKSDHWGYVEGFGKNEDVIIRETSGELWIIPEDELIEW